MAGRGRSKDGQGVEVRRPVVVLGRTVCMAVSEARKERANAGQLWSSSSKVTWISPFMNRCSTFSRALSDMPPCTHALGTPAALKAAARASASCCNTACGKEATLVITEPSEVGSHAAVEVPGCGGGSSGGGSASAAPECTRCPFTAPPLVSRRRGCDAPAPAPGRSLQSVWHAPGCRVAHQPDGWGPKWQAQLRAGGGRGMALAPRPVKKETPRGPLLLLLRRPLSPRDSPAAQPLCLRLAGSPRSPLGGLSAAPNDRRPPGFGTQFCKPAPAA